MLLHPRINSQKSSLVLKKISENTGKILAPDTAYRNIRHIQHLAVGLLKEATPRNIDEFHFITNIQRIRDFELYETRKNMRISDNNYEYIHAMQ